MRREGRGGSRGRSSRGGGSYRNNGYSKNDRYNNNRGGGRRNGYNNQYNSDGGNQRERVAVESGQLVLIDQFMLANPQFIDKFVENIDADSEVKNNIINHFGGVVVNIEPGLYRIDRDPYACSIIIHPEGYVPDVDSLAAVATDDNGTVYVDTRCLAMIDKELLDDSSLLEKYQQLWFSGQDKSCRDLLRDNGGAVRYGFIKNGDELGVHTVPDDDVVCLWQAIH